MFISKKRHLAEVSHLNACMDLLRSGYSAQVQDLKEQIQDLRQLVFPQATAGEVPKEAREADAVISASEKPPEMSEAELHKILEGAREMDLLVSGNYDQDLLNP